MRPHPSLLVLCLLAAHPAAGQVTVDLRALDGLDGRAAPAPAVPRPVVRPVPPRPPTVARASPAQASAAPPATAQATPTQTAAATPAPVAPPPPPAPPPATLPTAAPQTATIAPVAPPPPPTAAPPPPPPVVATAGGGAVAITGGMRVLFEPGHAELSPETDAKLHALARPDASFTVAAYAAGAPEDPSTPRRLALSRALAIRSALIEAGVPSTRITVRALGSAYGDGPPDRADVSLAGAPP